MKIRNIRNITQVALAVAVIAIAAPKAHAQMRVYSTNGGVTTSIPGFSANNSFYANAYGGYLNNYSPYFNNQGGALVLGSNGQLYNPFLPGGVEPTYNADGVTIPAPVGSDTAQQNPVQFSDQIEAMRMPGNLLKITWSGDPRPIASMQFSLLDSRRSELRNAIVTALPAQATFSRPSTAVYYRVTIVYSDGAVRSIVAPL